MRIAVTGMHGQVASAIAEAGPLRGHDVLRLARPELDLLQPATIAPALRGARPDLVVSAAAYTAVDRAESEEDIAMAVNARGAGAVAEAAAALGVPLIHLSTDFVFDGKASGAYAEEDAPAPINAYGRSKLAGERAVADAGGQHVIVRTSWVYAASGRNFVRTMLRLAEAGQRVRVVDDQIGNPTSAADLAQAILDIGEQLVGKPQDPAQLGVFHATGAGSASWADFAEAIFAASAAQNGPAATVERILTADYPTAARRPSNSRLSTAKLRHVYGIVLPPWQASLEACISRILHERTGGETER